jgi:hypothetical protein
MAMYLYTYGKVKLTVFTELMSPSRDVATCVATLEILKIEFNPRTHRYVHKNSTISPYPD